MLETRVRNLALIAGRSEPDRSGSRARALPNRERRLRGVLEPFRDRFEFVFIDTPPSLGLLTLNALVAADAVLIPLNCEYFALEGLADLVATLRRVRGAMNPSLDIAGVLMTMYDERTNLGQQVARTSASSFGIASSTPSSRATSGSVRRRATAFRHPLRREIARRGSLSDLRARIARA